MKTCTLGFCVCGVVVSTTSRGKFLRLAGVAEDKPNRFENLAAKPKCLLVMLELLGVAILTP